MALLFASLGQIEGQSPTFGGNAQHTSQFAAPAQRLNRVRWTAPVDLSNTGGLAHYGAPLITASNTVLVPVNTTNGFQLKAFEGTTGRLKYTLSTDYISPPAHWLPTYQATIATNSTGTRVYYPGAGGTMYSIANPDSETPGTPVQQCFYTSLTNYLTNAAAFNSTVFVNTPVTADSAGTIFFGFRVDPGGAPAPLNTTQGGYARIDAQGNATYVLASDAAGDSQIGRDSHNCAPALSNDGSTLYVAVKSFTNAFYSYLLGLDSTNLATKYKVLLRDPRNGNYAGVLDDGTASPMIGPDGDVFFGIFGNPANSSRGFLLHFSSDLNTTRLPSGFGWDYTPAIVPTNIVAAYTGPSSYLIVSKYNNYVDGDGNGVNRIALLDPNAAQVDPHATAAGLLEMREVLTVIGCTPDWYQLSGYPYAVREWCVNTLAVNPATASIFAPSEDGHLYRWNLAINSLTETVKIGPGVGEPYVPTIIGPDGTVYTINGGILFALGNLTNAAVALYSSAPDLRSGVAGEPVTFTAVVTNVDASGPELTRTVTFLDVTYEGLSATTNVLAANVPLTNGVASATTSALVAGSNNLGSHFITARWNGDDDSQSGSATLVQKVHANGTATMVNSSLSLAASNAAIFSASVTAIPQGGGTPSGIVSFWDRSSFLTQVPLDGNGAAYFTNTTLSPGSHAIWAGYSSDTMFASSTGYVFAMTPFTVALMRSGSGVMQLDFTNAIGAPFTVVSSTNLLLPLADWTPLGAPIEILPGQFRFADNQAPNETLRFYRVRSP